VRQADVSASSPLGSADHTKHRRSAPRRSRVAIGGLAFSLLAFLFAGIGSSVAASAATRADHETPIVIGSLGSYTGSQASSSEPALWALQAWVSSVNAAGGIDGHPLKMIVKEDNDSPSLGLTDAQELVSDHVAAIVGDWSDVDTDWVPYVTKAGIPIIGNAAGLGFGEMDVFPQQTTILDGAYGTLYALKKAGVTKFGVPYCAEIAACSEGVPLDKNFAGKLGMQLVWSGAFSASAPNLTPECLAASQAGATGLEPAAPSDSDIHLAEACAQQGLKFKYGTSDGTMTNQWLTIPAFNGTVAQEGDAPWFADSTPALKAYQAALKKYESGKAVNASSIEGWASGKLFQAAVAASGSKTVTPASVLAGLYSLKGATLGGIAPPLTFTKGTAAAVPCFFLVGIKNGKFIEPQGMKLSCAPAS
jgi:branched-chain amino acid transport system substrate-binding protein